MTNDLALQEAQDEAGWLTLSLQSLRHDQATRDRAMAVIDRLSFPAPSGWTMARIAALLNPYYEKETPMAIRVMEAEDWAVELEPYPQWAIQKAVRWWKSDQNDKRHKRPMEGDISARCNVEMGVVRAAQVYISKPLAAMNNGAQEPERVLPTMERRAEMAAEAFRMTKEMADRATSKPIDQAAA